jgi:hypothetical protein
MRRELAAVEIGRSRVSGLKHRAHGSVQNKYFLSGERSDFLYCEHHEPPLSSEYRYVKLCGEFSWT